MIDVLMWSLGWRNPYVRLIAKHLGKGFAVRPYAWMKPFQKADILHFHWPENTFAVGSLSKWYETRAGWLNLEATIGAVRRRGGALVWTAHNVERHEPFPPAIAAYAERHLRRFYASVDVAIAMSADQIPMLQQQFPDVAPDRWRVAAHPHYRTTYREWRSRPETRADLAIPDDAFVIVMLGNVRRYKGLLDAIGLVRSMRNPRLHLLIGGTCKDRALAAELQEAVAGADNIRLELTPLTRTAYASCQRAADLALFNFTQILNSGSILAALSMDCPVLAPRAAAFEALASRNGDWVDLFDGPLTAEILQRTIDRLSANPPSGQPDLDEYSPERIGEVHGRIYAEALELAARR
jgi:beta-1,4-mannosyltransferase